MLWVAEHGRITCGSGNRTLEDGDLQLCKADFGSLQSLLDSPEDDAPDYEPIFKYSQPYGQPRLTVQNHVGVVRTATGTQVEILPKVSKKMGAQQARVLLLKMLIELADSPFREGTAADLEAHEMPLFEILMRQFLHHTANIVRKGIAQTYVEHRDNLVYLRGKLQLAEHIRRNAAHADKMFCEYDEYEANRPINRLIKAALEIVAGLTQNATNQQLCRELLFSFDQVPATVDPQLDFQNLQRDRMAQHYEPALPACRMILEKLNPLTQQGPRTAISILFPMEKVFEDFVAAKLLDQFRHWGIKTQVTGQALVQKHLGRTIFGLRPDLELRQGGKRVIADTKWKLLNQSDRSNKYGISQGDIYQLFAYSKKYLLNQEVREVYLIYPASDTFTRPLAPFWYEQGQEVLHVVPYDLERELLVLPESCSLRGPEFAKAI